MFTRTTPPQLATRLNNSASWLAQNEQRNLKRAAPYEDSDQEEEDEGLILTGTKKQRLFQSSVFTSQTSHSSSVPSQANQPVDAFISPPVTPTLQLRETSDIAMEEDMDMAIDSQPSSQRDWNRPTALNTSIPSFVQQDSNLSAISMMDADEAGQIQRPHTPGMIMRDLTRLEVSPSIEGQRRGSWQSRAGPGPGPGLTAGAPKTRFTMGYRADCEKCRNRVPGHYAHPPS